MRCRFEPPCFCCFVVSPSLPLKLVSGWSAVDPSIAQQVAAVYILLIGGARALDMCLELVRA
jgi:hypothetical protein